MKIFGSCLVKNEADIIEETLEHAVTWCDHIIVDDNGSEDETWAIVQRMATKYPQITAWRSKAQPYGNKLRGEPFRAFRHLSQPGDWWTRLDSDERYIDDPRTFLARVPRWHHAVATAHFQYYLTDLDLDTIESSVQWSGLPVHERLHFYRCDASETRFFRYRPRIVWPETAAWPLHMGVTHPRRIRVRHLQYRSPQQMQLRLDTRQQAIREGCGSFRHHEGTHDWRQLVVPAASCHDDRSPDAWQIEEDKLPPFLEKRGRRLLKLLLHGARVWP